MSCPSASLCAAIGDPLIVYSSSHPVAGIWRKVALPGTPPGTVQAYLQHLACPSTTMCVATGPFGNIAVATNPAGGLGDWHTTKVDEADFGTALCWSTSHCSIPAGPGTVFTSRDPAGGAKAWTVSPTTPWFLSGSSPTTTLCVALAANPPRIVTTTNPDSGPWRQTPIGDTLNKIACASTSLCVAVGEKGVLYTSTTPTAGAWAKTTIDDGRALNSIACPTASLCVAVDGDGHVITSTDPTGGPATWAALLADQCRASPTCSDEQIQTSDGTGVHISDSSRSPKTGPFLTGLRLTGDTSRPGTTPEHPAPPN